MKKALFIGSAAVIGRRWGLKTLVGVSLVYGIGYIKGLLVSDEDRDRVLDRHPSTLPVVTDRWDP